MYEKNSIFNFCFKHGVFLGDYPQVYAQDN